MYLPDHDIVVTTCARVKVHILFPCDVISTRADIERVRESREIRELGIPTTKFRHDATP